MMDFEITKYDEEKDNLKLREFFKKVWAEDKIHLDEARWRWLFKNNPNNPNGQPQIWLIKQDERIVGQLATIPALFKIKNQYHLLYWAMDFIIDPEFRRKGLAYKGTVQLTKQAGLVMTLGDTPLLSYKLFKKLNFLETKNLPHLVKILDIQKITKNKFKKIMFISLKFLSDGLFSKIYSIHKKKLHRQYIKIEPIKNFDSKFDKLWQRVESNFSLVVKRDSLFLDWRYSRCPNSEYKGFQILKNDILSGYIILRLRHTDSGKEGIIADILSELNTLDYLIKKAIDYFIEQKANRIDCYISDKKYRHAFIKHGFSYWRTEVRLVVHQCKVVKNNIKLFKNISNWHITKGDSDLDR